MNLPLDLRHFCGFRILAQWRALLLGATALLHGEAMHARAGSPGALLAGTGKAAMAVFFPEVGMYGYGRPGNVVREEGTPLYVRALWLEQPSSGERFLFVSCELAFITRNVKDTVLHRLASTEGIPPIHEAMLMLTATHTHAAPGGFASDALFNVSTGGYHCGVFEGVVEGIVAAILAAHRDLRPSHLLWGEHRLEDAVPVGWNRALKAHKRNPEAAPGLDAHHTHLALDRTMVGLRTLPEDGSVGCSVNWFGVHATCVDNRNTRISGDNKGHASALMEQRHPGLVAMHVQAKAGDVSPNYHGADRRMRRSTARYRRKDHGHAHAADNGALQADAAEHFLSSAELDTLSPALRTTLLHVPMDRMPVDADLVGGRDGLTTAPGCYGVAFTQGTPVDGRGAPRWLLDLAWTFAFRRERYQGPAARELVAAHGPKRIAINAQAGTILGEKPHRSLSAKASFPDVKRQSAHMGSEPLVQQTVPVQLAVMGSLALVGLPGEITTVAGQRLEHVVKEALAPLGVQRVVISSYANAYIGYVTTPEEYAVQTYEGGHTLFGPWELAGFQTAFRWAARQLLGEPVPGQVSAPRHDPELLLRRSFKGSCPAPQGP